MDTSPDGLLKLNRQLRIEMDGMVPLWNECGRMCVTRKVQSLTASTSQTGLLPGTGFRPEMALLNTVAVEANKTLAAGRMSWITPSDSPWFKWKPAPQLEQEDAVIAWLDRCTEIAQYYLSASNFYSRAHEANLDLGTFGTACIWAEEGRKSPLFFRTFDVGSFCIAQNSEALVNTVLREVEYTAEQAKEEFGAIPATVEKTLQTDPTRRHRFVHALYERPDDERGEGQTARRYASCWIHEQTKQKVKETGYDELPAMASRYLMWSEASAYGASPAMEALAEIRGVNYLEDLFSTAVELGINPRIIMPQTILGPPDLRAGGLTMGGATKDSHPQEWLTGARVDWALPMLERKEKMIQEMFHRSLFDQFTLIERQITAAEVRAREAEKLARFSPAFTQYTTEVINPLLERVFMLLFRAGKFPPPPREALMTDSAGNLVLLYPQVVQTSRMALALQSLKKSAFGSLIEVSIPLEQMGRPVMDNFDWDVGIRDIARGDGLPASYIRDSEAVEATRVARAQAQAAAQQAEMMREAMKSKPLVEKGIEAMEAAA